MAYLAFQISLSVAFDPRRGMNPRGGRLETLLKYRHLYGYLLMQA